MCINYNRSLNVFVCSFIIVDDGLPADDDDGFNRVTRNHSQLHFANSLDQFSPLTDEFNGHSVIKPQLYHAKHKRKLQNTLEEVIVHVVFKIVSLIFTDIFLLLYFLLSLQYFIFLIGFFAYRVN